MTSPEKKNVTPEPNTRDDEALAPATPGAEALPLPEDAVESPQTLELHDVTRSVGLTGRAAR